MALTNKLSVVVTPQKSRNELFEQYRSDMVDKSLTVWNALNEAIDRDSTTSPMVMRVKSPSTAWVLLKKMEEGDDSDTGVREYITRAKGLAAAVRYHGVDLPDKQLGNRTLRGLPSHRHFLR